jgi:hypothetical protein
MKEHHKIGNIPKFRCEMLLNANNIALRNLQFSVILDYTNGKWLPLFQNFDLN